MPRKKSKRVKNVDNVGHNYNEEASCSSNPCIQATAFVSCGAVMTIPIMSGIAGIGCTIWDSLVAGFAASLGTHYSPSPVSSFSDCATSAAVSVGSAVLSPIGAFASAMVTSPVAMTVASAAVGFAVGYGLFAHKRSADATTIKAPEMREELNQHVNLTR